MYHPGYETTFEFWHVPYVAYILWISGLMSYFLLATTKDAKKILVQLRDNWLGKLFIIWAGGALWVAGLAWPLLIAGPFLLVQVGAPVHAGIIAAGYAILSLYLSGRLMMERWPGISHY